MDRLQAELQRLYAAQEPGADGQVRAMVLGVAGPDSWDRLSTVWQAVQAELQWPAPGIAVSGTDGHQLWFSLAQPVAGARASAMLEALRRRWLADVPPERIAMAPSEAAQHVGGVPPAQLAPGRWSAFVAPDLAALFAEEHWLDLEPTADAQADLLSRLQGVKPADFQRALDLLVPTEAAEVSPTRAPQHQDPRHFLLEVMNDRAVELHLRIEAAKALLPYCEGHAGARH